MKQPSIFRRTTSLPPWTLPLCLALAGRLTADPVTFTPTSGAQSWNTGSSWSSGTAPSGAGVAVAFTAPTAAETVTLGASRIVGSLTIHDSTVSTTANFSLLATGPYTLSFATTSGNATVEVDGTGTAAEAINTTTALTSPLDVSVDNTSVTSDSGALTFAGSMTGSNGFSKDGDGTCSFGSNAKAYTGATTINAGVLRVSVAGSPGGTSGITVNSGGQLRLDNDSGAFSFNGGTVTVSLSGAGDTNLSGTKGVGALTDYGASTTTLANPVQLAAASTVYVNSGTATLMLNGIVSGANGLTKAGAGTLLFNNAGNTFSGGLTVSAGTVGGSGTLAAPVSVSSGGTLLGGTGTTGSALTLSGNLTLATGSVVGLTLGATGAHSTLARSGGTWSFDAAQSFALSGTPAPGFYDNVITGLAVDPGTENQWAFTNPNYVGSFNFDGTNIDLTLTSVPEPTPALGGLLLLGAAAWSVRRRGASR